MGLQLYQGIYRCVDVQIFVFGTHTLLIYVIAPSNSEESERVILCFEEAV